MACIPLKCIVAGIPVMNVGAMLYMLHDCTHMEQYCRIMLGAS